VLPISTCLKKREKLNHPTTFIGPSDAIQGQSCVEDGAPLLLLVGLRNFFYGTMAQPISLFHQRFLGTPVFEQNDRDAEIS
jgi:hypothetical protein